MDLSYRIGRILFKIISFIFFPVKTRGLENLPKDGTFVLAANHVSNLDPFLIGTFCGKIINFVAKEELFQNKLVGLWISSLGAFPIRRDSADFRGVRETFRRLQKHSILIFPEGTRKRDGSDSKIQQGVGFIAKKSKKRVFPVYIDGSQRALPPGCHWPKGRHTVTITFGPEIEFSSADSYPQIASRIVDEIYLLSGEKA